MNWLKSRRNLKEDGESIKGRFFRYATIYTMFPVFSLVLDKDVSVCTALLYPELYKDLSKGRSLSFKTFFIWVLVSIYQGKRLRTKEDRSSFQVLRTDGDRAYVPQVV